MHWELMMHLVDWESFRVRQRGCTKALGGLSYVTKAL